MLDNLMQIAGNPGATYIQELRLLVEFKLDRKYPKTDAQGATLEGLEGLLGVVNSLGYSIPTE